MIHNKNTSRVVFGTSRFNALPLSYTPVRHGQRTNKDDSRIVYNTRDTERAYRTDRGFSIFPLLSTRDILAGEKRFARRR